MNQILRVRYCVTPCDKFTCKVKLLENGHKGVDVSASKMLLFFFSFISFLSFSLKYRNFAFTVTLSRVAGRRRVKYLES